MQSSVPPLTHAARRVAHHLTSRPVAAAIYIYGYYAYASRTRSVFRQVTAVSALSGGLWNLYLGIVDLLLHLLCNEIVTLNERTGTRKLSHHAVSTSRLEPLPKPTDYFQSHLQWHAAMDQCGVQPSAASLHLRRRVISPEVIPPTTSFIEASAQSFSACL